jgi:hypothetical protein
MQNIVPPSKFLCPGCKLWLEISAFSQDKNSKYNKQTRCRACQKRERAEFLTPEKRRDQHLRLKYGITSAQYEHMLNQQHGVCAVCKMPETHRSSKGTITPLAIDHDHETGDIRALLCFSCNVAFGQLKEDTDRIQKLKDYAEWCKNRKPSGRIIQLPLLLAQPDIDRSDDAV